MTTRNIATREEWLAARKELLDREKALSREHDALAQARRALPWVKIEQDYVFETESGSASFDDLFGGYRQLIVQHFMLGPDWENGCVSCSFWADNFNGTILHLNARNISFKVISSAPLAKILPFKQRMGWTFDWVSSFGGSFNEDFNVSFGPDHKAEDTVFYNFRETNFPADEAPGASAFAKGDDGTIYHTYSTYGRGLDVLNGAYAYMDIAPFGRDEVAEGHKMGWLRHHDSY
ncbi:MAG: DUF899 domain-containing protein [Rhodospirillaceae bacterium]|jgi:predicted dithiol-disulfide oxidoreductase (DUF899 family)|nr:DUF899 domain-containing protein [Rhodospirillaceae bacterium]MBT4487993.1 DUF899 domain-containing protein [Rhodospirillaceae bacterium]MBT5192884.1 DUF899 domain-containing protein [Rhodospirillaceae bacterium]MBT5894753.1 DUF899 domain-containing protein [Rhodospirillaceae bacterium]MBT6426329.1 DUF899 domain-containing protein [Rhodospirillaceae bacterium]